VCTVSGDTVRHGVGEFEMGTPLAEVIETVGRGPLEGRHIVAALLGTANAMLLADELDTPMSYEAMAGAGTGLGTGGIIVFDDSRDLLDVGRAVSHYLAIESCGQCEPCKFDGQTIAADLGDLVSGRADAATIAEIRQRVGSVGRGARCALARQHEAVIGDLLVRCRDEFDAHVDVAAAPSNPVVIAPIVELVDGRFVLDEDFLRKQPDWSHDEVDSGEMPVDRLGSAPVVVGAPHAPAERAGSRKQRRDPFAALLALHDMIRDDLDAALATDGKPGRPVSDLAEHLATGVEVGDRLIYPTVERVTAAADDAVWSAQLHGLDALAVASALEPTDQPDGHRLDRLARDVRRHLDDNERIVYPLLRLHLDEAEQTNLADAVDEMLAAPQR
jgi:hypothetical protein